VNSFLVRLVLCYLTENVTLLKQTLSEKEKCNCGELDVDIGKFFKKMSDLAQNYFDLHIATTLSTSPRSLHALWEGYERVIGGCRAVMLFTGDERGGVKHNYHRRKIVYVLISAIVRGGISAQVLN
jgi:hypothetical protein